MVKPVQYGRVERMSYSKINEVLDIPDLVEIQKSSYQWFLNEGIREVLDGISPIRDFSGNIELTFLETEFDTTQPTWPVEERKTRDTNYAAPMRVMVRLHNKREDVVKEQQIYIGEFPIMTDTGTFIINGTERVIVSQLHRSSGVFFSHDKGKTHASGRVLYSARIIPSRGSWLDFEFDAKDILYVRIDRRRKLPATIVLKALGYSNEDLLSIF